MSLDEVSMYKGPKTSNNREKEDFFMKPMLLTYVDNIPEGDNWIYEVKYDGFRSLLFWDQKLKLISRNNNDLTLLFPEILAFSEKIFEIVKPYLPIALDGEIVYLQNIYRSDFSIVQKRSKLRLENQIEKFSKQLPCQFIAFDVLQFKGKDVRSLPLVERKKLLDEFFKEIHHTPLQKIEVFNDAKSILEVVNNNNSEGIVAKSKKSFWESGVRSKEWLKCKNWRIVTVILTKYNETNGYFHGSVYNEKLILNEVAIFRHGFTDDEEKTLVTFIKQRGKLKDSIWVLPPSICADILCIDFDGAKLREPRFYKFRFDISPDEVTWRKMLRQLNPLPEKVQITHPDKPIWPKLDIVKDDFLYYLQCVSPYFLPFLKNRLLTAIRFPHGLVSDERFYQKNAPDYKPTFIQTKKVENIEYILCNNLETLIWLGNQLTLEFHIPFQTIDTNCPTEIVFDLDPPSIDEFSLAIEAALMIKEVLDQFKIQTFVKTSGNKGLQIYIPLRKNTFTYEETRVFTEFVALYLCEQQPQWFTVERLKKNRNNKLYIDYVQHGEGKTIIAPYSTRGNEEALVATPLFWEEVTSKLHPTLFSIPAVIERIQNLGNPFQSFFEKRADDNLKIIIDHLKDMKKKRD